MKSRCEELDGPANLAQSNKILIKKEITQMQTRSFAFSGLGLGSAARPLSPGTWICGIEED